MVNTVKYGFLVQCEKETQKREREMLRLRVREIAESKGYNMSSLSRASDVSFNTIKRLWKDPYRETSTVTLQRIAKALGVPTSALLEDEEERRQD
jgi:transcriptional regulator with XRE-family HTH domain